MMYCTNDAELDVHISTYLHSTTDGVTGSLVLVGQAGSDSPPPHTPGAMTVTVQLYSLLGLIADEDIVALLV